MLSINGTPRLGWSLENQCETFPFSRAAVSSWEESAFQASREWNEEKHEKVGGGGGGGGRTGLLGPILNTPPKPFLPSQQPVLPSSTRPHFPQTGNLESWLLVCLLLMLVWIIRFFGSNGSDFLCKAKLCITVQPSEWNVNERALWSALQQRFFPMEKRGGGGGECFTRSLPPLFMREAWLQDSDGGVSSWGGVNYSGGSSTSFLIP